MENIIQLTETGAKNLAIKMALHDFLEDQKTAKFMGKKWNKLTSRLSISDCYSKLKDLGQTEICSETELVDLGSIICEAYRDEYDRLIKTRVLRQ